MGAEFNEHKFPAGTKKENLVEAAEDVFSQARYDYGHAGYSGSFAECDSAVFAPEVFNTDEGAYDWLSEQADKWGSAVIVTVQSETDEEPIYYMGAWCSS